MNVSVLIYDEDHITEDDLIGSAQVDLETLDPWVPIEQWVQVQSKYCTHGSTKATARTENEASQERAPMSAC